MTSIKISNQLSTTSTTISNVFIDRYMPSANGEFVKVYLYLIRMASCGQSPTITDMADALNNTESDIIRALRYWQKQELLIIHCNAMNDLEFIELLPIPEETDSASYPFNVVTGHNVSSGISGNLRTGLPQHAATGSVSRVSASKNEAQTAAANAPVPKEEHCVVNMPPAKPNYDMKTIQHSMEHSDMKHLPYEAEILLGSTLSSDDLNTLYYLYDKLGFSADMISYLIEYCVMNNKKSMRYIEKTAIDWHEHHIHTTEDARQYTSSYSKLNSAVMRALGLTGNSLAQSQLNYVQKWSNVYGFDQSMIIEACNRTMLQTGNPSFQYADKILTNWHNRHITCLADVEKEDQSYRASHTHNNYKNTAKKPAGAPNQFHDFIQGEEVDYDAIIPKTIQPLSGK